MLLQEALDAYPELRVDHSTSSPLLVRRYFESDQLFSIRPEGIAAAVEMCENAQAIIEQALAALDKSSDTR
jgi:hypothetical protein